MPRVASLGLVLVTVFLSTAAALPAAAAKKRPPPVVGRWNLTVTTPEGANFPSWLELTADDDAKLSGRFCGRTGVARPLARAEWKKNVLTFVETVTDPTGVISERLYTAKIRYGMLEGTLAGPRSSPMTFLATRPPRFHERNRVPWGKPVPLISKGLIGWRLRGSKLGACWKESAGVLSTRGPCVDIISDGRYQDFKLHLEFMLAPGSSSGVYLRARYEIAVSDDAGKPPTDQGSGSIHGLVTPLRNAAGKPGAWQTLDAILVGRKVTVVLNGDTVIASQEIAGPTGGALDSDEVIPGSIMLQGSDQPLSFRNIVVTPALW